jgi:hypothetical protein
MCGKKPKVDDSIQREMLADSREARAREEARQERIRQGTGRVDETFSQFNDDFFRGIRDNYMDFYQPQADEQFRRAGDQLSFGLARAGTSNSSIAARNQADLTTRYNDTLASLLSQATGEADRQRSRVQGEKSSLVSLLNATGDADRISNEALARTQQLYQERPAYNPIGDIFGGFAQGLGGAMNTINQRRAYNAYMGTGTGGTGSSSRIVG